MSFCRRASSVGKHGQNLGHQVSGPSFWFAARWEGLAGGRKWLSLLVGLAPNVLAARRRCAIMTFRQIRTACWASELPLIVGWLTLTSWHWSRSSVKHCNLVDVVAAVLRKYAQTANTHECMRVQAWFPLQICEEHKKYLWNFTKINLLSDSSSTEGRHANKGKRFLIKHWKFFVLSLQEPLCLILWISIYLHLFCAYGNVGPHTVLFQLPII